MADVAAKSSPTRPLWQEPILIGLTAFLGTAMGAWYVYAHMHAKKEREQQRIIEALRPKGPIRP